MSYSPSQILKVAPVPSIAVPTVALFLFSMTIEVVVIYLLHTDSISPFTATLVNTWAIFTVFTPMHDAAHGSIANRNYSIVNDIVGHMAGLCFPVPFPAFKHLHLLHHKHTNDEEDPDIWAGSGPWFLLPLKWLTIEFNYYSLYIPKIHLRPLKEALITLVELLGFIALALYLFRNGHGRTAFWGWLLPGRLALGFLAYFFDYLPHHPHLVTRKENEFLATSVTSLFGDQTFYLTWPLLHQNYHNIHHIAPYIPFYMYSTVWHAFKTELVAKGTQIKPIL